MIKPVMTADDVEVVQQHMERVKVQHSGELDRLQEKQRAAVEREVNRSKDRERDQYPSPPNSAGVHPDLHDLSFGELGSRQGYEYPHLILPAMWLKCIFL